MKNLNKIKLKVKALSLQEEAKIIKRLEKGCEDENGVNPIYLHRIQDVRTEARATNLARAFLAGKNYKTVENSRKFEKEWEFKRVKKRLYNIIRKYGEFDFSQHEVDKWLLGL